MKTLHERLTPENKKRLIDSDLKHSAEMAVRELKTKTTYPQLTVEAFLCLLNVLSIESDAQSKLNELFPLNQNTSLGDSNKKVLGKMFSNFGDS